LAKTALNAIKPFFDGGESAVGTFVNVRHVAATAVNRRIVAHAEVTSVDGRNIEFDVQAVDGGERIGRGTHGRAVINLARFDELLATKYRAKSA
jgi:predicted thioesterase